jgi:polyhydroxyalkanoate synthesis regulator phasin
MPIYTINGREVETDKELTDSDIDEIASSLQSATPQQPNLADKPAPIAQEQSWMDKAGLTLRGQEGQQSVLKSAVQDPLVGFAQGAITDIPVGVAQLGANVFGSPETAAKANELVNQYEDLGGSTVMRILGGFANPLNKFLPGGGKTAASTVGKSIVGGTAASALNPTVVTEGGDFTNNKLFQAGLGAVLGGAIPLTLLGGGKLAGFIGENVNLSKNAQVNAIREYINKLAGKEREDVIKELETVGELVTGSKPTALDVIGDRPSAAGLAAEQLRVQPTSVEFGVRRAEQEAARAAAVGDVAQPEGTTLAQLEKIRTQYTAPLREKALQDANVYGEQAPQFEEAAARALGGAAQRTDVGVNAQGAQGLLQAQGMAETQAAQALNRAASEIPVATKSSSVYYSNLERAAEQKQLALGLKDSVSAKKAEIEFNKNQIKLLNENGYFPLETAPITQELNKITSTPGLRAKEGVTDVIKDVSDRLQEFTTNKGFIDSNDLYAIRQTLNSSIMSSYSKKQATPDSKLVRGLQKQVEMLIDGAINKATGSTTWSQYLNNYSKYSQKMDRMKIGSQLLSTLKGEGGDLGAEQAGKFVEAVVNSEALIQKATGNKMYSELSDVMTKSEINKLQTVVADLKRTASAERLASKIESPTFDKGSVQLPGLIDSRIAIANSILGYVKRGDSKAMDTLVADLMLNPKKLAAFMQEPDKGKMDLLLKAIGKTVSSDVGRQFVSRIGLGAAQAQ